MGGTVLVADVDTEYRSALERLYTRLGCSVLATLSGHKAREALRGGTIELAVLDYHLRGMTAVDVISAAREEGVSTLLIATIGRNSPRVEREIRAVGVDFFLLKPYPMYDIELVSTKLFEIQSRPSSHAPSEEQLPRSNRSRGGGLGARNRN